MRCIHTDLAALTTHERKTENNDLFYLAKKGDHADIAAPRGMVSSLEPCDACQAKFELGIHMVEVSDDDSLFNGNQAFALKGSDGKLHWPTGRWAVVPSDSIENGKLGTRGLCSKETMDMIYSKTKGKRK